MVCSLNFLVLAKAIFPNHPQKRSHHVLGIRFESASIDRTNQYKKKYFKRFETGRFCMGAKIEKPVELDAIKIILTETSCSTRNENSLFSEACQIELG